MRHTIAVETFARLCRSLAAAALLLAVQAATAAADDVAERFRAHDAASVIAVDHSAWSKLLETYVSRGADGVARVDYAAFKRDGAAALKAYVKTLEAVDVAALNRSEQFAFWANLYNARTVDIVLEHYPVDSIKDIRLTLWKPFDGPWEADVVKVKGQALSLNDIEHGILRVIWRDPRVHYAVNCASVGCPDLPRQAFTGTGLDAMLDAAARAYVNSPRGVRVGNGDVVASKIYTWFVEDFGGDEKGVLAHLREFAAPPLAEALASAGEIDDYVYDWTLNDVAR